MPDFKDLKDEQQKAIIAWDIANDPEQDRYDCRDNYRYAIKGNAEHEAAYNEAEANGCCGFMDVEITVGDVVILYGFNYGH